MTAQEYLNSLGRQHTQLETGEKLDAYTITAEQLKEYGKQQWNAALEAAAENVELEYIGCMDDVAIINRNSILNLKK